MNNTPRSNGKYIPSEKDLLRVREAFGLEADNLDRCQIQVCIDFLNSATNCKTSEGKENILKRYHHARKDVDRWSHLASVIG